MGRIVVRFEGLCVLFNNKLNGESGSLPALTAGFLEVNDETLQKLPSYVSIEDDDFHLPKLTVYKLLQDENDELQRKQILEKEIAGDLSLDTYPTSTRLRGFTEETDIDLYNRIRDEIDSTLGEPESFKVVNVAQEWYSSSETEARLELCKARFHVKTGALFAINSQSYKVGAADIDGNLLSETSDPFDVTAPIKAGLELEVPDDGYALLYFSDGTPALKFYGRKNYEIALASLSINSVQTAERNHFLYFYSIFLPQPPELLTPAEIEMPTSGTFNNPYCTIIGGGGD